VTLAEIEELRAIKAERDAKDPLKSYVPGKTQQQCMTSKKMLRLLSGPNRSGKTAHNCVEFAMCARRVHPTRTVGKPVIYVMWAISREQIRDVLYQKLRVRSELEGPGFNEPMIPDHEVVKDHMTNGAGKPVCREIELKNGNRILFAISGVDKSWQSIQGKGYIAGIGVDEQAGTQKLIDECMARLMELNNPKDVAEFGGAWFLWSTSETIINDSWDTLKALALDPDRNQDAEYLLIEMNENRAVSQEARQRVGQFMSADARAIRIEGTGNARAATLVYGKQWSDERHILKADHVPSINANIWVGYDPGVDHPMGMGAFCVEPSHPMQLIGVRFWNYRGLPISEDVKNLANWLGGRRLAGFVYDTNLKNRNSGGGPTVLDQFKDAMQTAGVDPIGGYWQARKQVNAGIALVRHYLDPSPANRQTEPLLRFNPSEESGGKVARWQFLKYSGHEEKQFTGPGSIIKKDDEITDLTRYVVMQRPSWNPQWTCGTGVKGYQYVVPSTDPANPAAELVLTDEQLHFKRLFDLSRLAASHRSRGRR
jgi:hypothetical protein